MKAMKTLSARAQETLGGYVSAVTNRMSISNLVGRMFHGQRDLYAVFGYNRVPLYQESWQRYRRQDIASRVIDAPVNALWSNPPIVSSTDDTWNKAWNDIVINHSLWSAIARADKMAGLGNYSVLLVGLNGGKKLDIPAMPMEGAKVIYLQPYDYGCTSIVEIEADSSKPRFGKPRLYQITPTRLQQPKPAAMPAVPSFTIHYSRLVHIAENCLSDEIFGNPRIERVWNLLDDLLKVCGGTAETFWLTANRGMQVDVDKEMDLSPDDETALSEEIEEYINQLRRVIRTRGVKITNLGSETPDPKGIFDMIMCLMAGATGIPKRILLGSEAGQLASGEDRNNWAERIEERRKDFGEPVVLWPLIRVLTNAGVLPEISGNISINWPDAFRLTPLEKAMQSAQSARSATNLAKAMDLNSKLITVDEARAFMGLDTPEVTVEGTTLIAGA